MFIEKSPFATEKQQADLKRDVMRVWAMTYPLQQAKDVAFELGRVLMGLKDYGAAVGMFEASQAFCGEHHISWCARARVHVRVLR